MMERNSLVECMWWYFMLLLATSPSRSQIVKGSTKDMFKIINHESDFWRLPFLSSVCCVNHWDVDSVVQGLLDSLEGFSKDALSQVALKKRHGFTADALSQAADSAKGTDSPQKAPIKIPHLAECNPSMMCTVKTQSTAQRLARTNCCDQRDTFYTVDWAWCSSVDLMMEDVFFFKFLHFFPTFWNLPLRQTSKARITDDVKMWKIVMMNSWDDFRYD